MVTIKFNIDNGDLRSLKRMPTEFRRGAEIGFRKAVLFLEGKAKKEFTKSRGSAGGLHVRSGHLRRSITSKSEGLQGWLGSNVVYAATHEFGATIKAKNSKYLKFKTEHGWVSKKQVTIPARPFLMPVIDDYHNNMLEIIYDNIKEEVE